MKVGIDVDGVLRMFADSLVCVYQRKFGSEGVVPIKDWNEYPLHNYFPIGRGIYTFFTHIEPIDIYHNAKTYPQAKLFTERLTRDGHDVYIVSKQPNLLAEELTKMWLDKNKIHYNRTIFTDDKSSIRELDILLDDCTDNLKIVDKVGKTLPVCFDRPWNRDWEGARVYSFGEFLNHYISKN